MSFIKPRIVWALAAMAVGQAAAQTRIDLRTQSKSIDFSSASSTKPSQTGASLPPTCAVGQTFLNTSAPAGLNLFVCTAANVWTAQGGIGAGSYSARFVSVTSVTVPGTAHQLGTSKLLVEVYDSQTPSWLVEPDYVQINPTTYDVTVKFATPQTGTIVISAASGAGTGSSAGSGNSGVGMTAQLGDFLVTRTNGTTLAVGANCSPSTPCNARLGGVVFSVTQGATVTLNSGTGTAYFYIDPAGNLTVGHNLALTCSPGCVASSGITAFPVNAIPLFTWQSTNGSWNAAGVDWRAFLAAKTLAAGPGIITVEAGSQTQIAVDSAAVPTYITGAAPLTFPSIPPTTCATELTLTLPGAAVGDSVAAGWPGSLPAGVLGIMRVSVANTVAVRLCNFSAAATTPPSATFRATIVRSF
jgi:hypothetical protein